MIGTHKTNLCSMISFVAALSLIFILGINEYSVELGNHNLPDLEIDYGQSRDKVTYLPDQPAVDFNQYAGYISVDELKERALFYYFVEAEVDPASKPLVLWLHGGPGCSSVGGGAFEQHGPFQTTENGGLIKNHYSWNKVANMLYLDAPAGVGFSININDSHTNDEIAARENLVFVQNWFNKFPMYKNNDFFISGESYAGHFAPQLAQLILSDTEINLKGIAIGNPLLDFERDFNSRAYFLWSHGLISHSTFEKLATSCNYSQIIREYASPKYSSICLEVNKLLQSEVTGFVDTFDISFDGCLPSDKQQAYMMINPKEQLEACTDDRVFKYLNRNEVQRALHAELVGFTSWSACRLINYDGTNPQVPTISLLGTLVKSGVRVMVYSGDQDAIIPFIGTEFLVNGLAKDLGLNATSYRSWFYRKQVAGWTQVYGGILTFATIKGAGHSAPYSQPGRSLVLMRAFLEGKQLPHFL